MNRQVLAVMATLGVVTCGMAAELWIGAAEVSITPDRPISLAGQFHQRISKKVESPCTANVLALEARESGRPAG